MHHISRFAQVMLRRLQSKVPRKGRLQAGHLVQHRLQVKGLFGGYPLEKSCNSMVEQVAVAFVACIQDWHVTKGKERMQGRLDFPCRALDQQACMYREAAMSKCVLQQDEPAPA